MSLVSFSLTFLSPTPLSIVPATLSLTCYLLQCHFLASLLPVSVLAFVLTSTFVPQRLFPSSTSSTHSLSSTPSSSRSSPPFSPVLWSSVVCIFLTYPISLCGLPGRSPLTTISFSISFSCSLSAQPGPPLQYSSMTIRALRLSFLSIFGCGFPGMQVL